MPCSTAPASSRATASSTSPVARASLAGLGHIQLENASDADIEALLTCGLEGVGALEISRGTVSPEAIAGLLVDGAFPRLRKLTLAMLAPLQHIAWALGGRPPRRERFALELRRMDVDEDGLAALAGEPAMRAVERMPQRIISRSPPPSCARWRRRSRPAAARGR